MKRILILFASSHGQTAKIAHSLSRRLAAAGHDVITRDIAAGRPPPANEFDAVLLGSRVEIGGFARPIARYAAANRAVLEARWSGFYSVSMSEASPDEKGRAAVHGIIDAWLHKIGWHPRRTASFAGALAYTQYGAVTRWVMKRISAANGGATDTTRDHEYTDWAAVDALADTMCADLAASPPQFSPPPPEIASVPAGPPLSR